jgi:pimeloyl-ACP methyl ester carboxylesterase
VAFDAPAHGRSSGGKTHLGEFFDTIEQLQQIHGPFEGSIGHSFGGQVNFYSCLDGIQIKKMILIGSPSRADNILENYLAKINGSNDRIAYFRQYVIDNHQLEFETLTTTSMANRLEEMPVLIIHDKDDKEVSLGDARALKELLPFANLIETNGLGHNRILKNEQVIRYCLDFMHGNDASA